MNLISYHHTNIRLVSFLLIICATSTRAQQQPTTVNTDSIFRVLDYTISQADTYLKKKQDTLRQIHEKYYQAKTTANRYEELSRLYDEYRYFNNDSALHCDSSLSRSPSNSRCSFSRPIIIMATFY